MAAMDTLQSGLQRNDLNGAATIADTEKNRMGGTRHCANHLVVAADSLSLR